MKMFAFAMAAVLALAGSADAGDGQRGFRGPVFRGPARGPVFRAPFRGIPAFRQGFGFQRGFRAPIFRGPVFRAPFRRLPVGRAILRGLFGIGYVDPVEAELARQLAIQRQLQLQQQLMYGVQLQQFQFSGAAYGLGGCP